MTYPTRSASGGATASAGAVHRTLHVAAERNGNSRMTSRTTTSRRSAKSRQAPPQDLRWDAVQEIFQRSRTRFVGLAYSILRDQDDAEDAVQNAMLSAYLHLRTFEGRSALTTWVTRIVLNAALMIRRKRKSSHIDLFPDSAAIEDPSWAEKVPGRQPNPETACLEAEKLRWIDHRLAKMSPLLRQALVTAYYDELSVEEGAALLGISEGTYKSRVFRAKGQLLQWARRSLLTLVRGATNSGSEIDT